jgi:hypothetical protein
MFQALMELDSLGHDIMIDIVEIAPAFTFVTEKGLVPGRSDYKPREFGNAVLFMEGASFSLRLERDRGEVFVDVGNDAAGWHKLEYVIEFLDNSITQQQLGEPPRSDAMAGLLYAYWDRVISLFNDKKLTQQLQNFEDSKASALLGNIFKK